MHRASAGMASTGRRRRAQCAHSLPRPGTVPQLRLWTRSGFRDTVNGASAPSPRWMPTAHPPRLRFPLSVVALRALPGRSHRSHSSVYRAEYPSTYSPAHRRRRRSHESSCRRACFHRNRQRCIAPIHRLREVDEHSLTHRCTLRSVASPGTPPTSPSSISARSW